jgi:hypothetical protein
LNNKRCGDGMFAVPFRQILNLASRSPCLFRRRKPSEG